MRATLIAFLMLGSSRTEAQPGSVERPLHMVVTLDHGLYGNGTHQYMVITPGNDTLMGDDLHPAQGDSVLSFMVNSSHDDRPWSVKYLPGGAMMDLHLSHDPMPLGYTLRLPFTQGAFELDSRRVMKCLADQAEDLQVRDAQRPGWNLEHPFGAVDTLACHGGRLVYSRGGVMHTEVHIPDLMPFLKRVPRMPPTAERLASYPGGMSNFERFITSHFSRALLERVGVRVKLSALVTVESDGSIHQVHANGEAYPELYREFKRVLQLSSWWEPAVVEDLLDKGEPPSFRRTEQSLVIEHVVDPDDIWSDISEEWLALEPVVPSSTDSVDIHLRWIGGSCGKYAATTEVLPQRPDQDFREVILRFGAELPPLCEDNAEQHFIHRMQRLSPGRYRLRRLPHSTLPEGGGWHPDPYRVKYFEVKP
ncbi:MAG: hypothetical protein JNM62_10710 [Flavobacteriales bacterium]|nr:hypothetical protein [Flavobacteriales bacterium]